MFIYAPEVYPTEVRGLATGVLNCCARIGAIITPFVGVVLLHRSIYLGVGAYAISGIIAAIASYFLNIETKGKTLEDLE